MKWKFSKGDRVQADLSFSGDYVISHRPQEFTVCYRPPGKHFHVATVKTLSDAKTAAERHAKGEEVADPHALTERPCAGPGLISYRCRNPFGYTLIGARDHTDAFREAKRSDDSAEREKLEVWNGPCYVKC